jgi:hypothetical protein
MILCREIVLLLLDAPDTWPDAQMVAGKTSFIDERGEPRGIRDVSPKFQE